MSSQTTAANPEAAARARNSRVLAEAGIPHPGSSSSADGPSRQGFGPPGLRGGIRGAGASSAAGSPLSSRDSSSTDFAVDYSDPLLSSDGALTTFTPPNAEMQLSQTVECPQCHIPLSNGAQTCTACGFELSQTPGSDEDTLLLSKLTAEQRKKLPESAFVFPTERRYPIHDISHARNALSRASGKSEEAKVKVAVYKRYPELQSDKKNMSRDGHAASFYDSLKLAEEHNGLVWKAICKTGTLALSPGPGQIDVEKPLELTPELFSELKASVDEKAFPYVTVPTTHTNGLLENTGYVQDVAIKASDDPNDPPGTQVLWAAIGFTEPEIEEKVKRGTIPDTSVGVKFNYRNKRTGKQYKAALEHVALTHQPWVDGLTPFGQSLSQEGVFDQQEMESDWDGVYVHADRGQDEDTGDILPSNNEVDGIPTHFSSTKSMPKSKQHTRRRRPSRIRTAAGDQVPDTVEELLASQQARIEAAEKRNSELETQLSQQDGRVASQEASIHLSNVGAKVKKWQDNNLPPAIVKAAKDILLAAGPQPSEVTEDSAVLTLSITKEPESEGDAPEVEERHLSVDGIVDMLLAAVPRIGPGSDVTAVMREMDAFNASQRTDEKSAEERAKEILEEAEELGSGIA